MENATINIQCKLNVSTVIYFSVTPKTKIDFVENSFSLIFFFLFFLAL